jgi:hypothetical protein
VRPRLVLERKVTEGHLAGGVLLATRNAVLLKRDVRPSVRVRQVWFQCHALARAGRISERTNNLPSLRVEALDGPIDHSAGSKWSDCLGFGGNA